MSDNNICCKKKQCEFHKLTKQIADLQLQKNKLYKKNVKECNTDKHCSICLCLNPKYTIKTDSGEISNLCEYCVNKVKKNSHPSKSPYEFECPVCGEIDGIYVIKNLTNNLCQSCYDKINKI